MSWIPVAAWVAAAVVAVVVLAFCAYEITWKSRRLRTDLATLQRLGTAAAGLQTDVAAAQDRLAAVQRSRAGGR